MASEGKKKGGFLRKLGWFVLIVVAFELGLRLFGYGNYTIYRPDEKLLWVPVPGRTVTVDNHLPITINNQGLRYASDLTAKPRGEFRIIAFGDSATQGWGVDDNSTYAAFLGQKLNQDSCPGEHIVSVSAGVNAYPNALVGEKLKEVEEDPTFQPDIVIRAYSFNSNFERLPKLEGAAREKFLRQVEAKAIIRRSAIYNFVIEDLLRRAVYYKMRHVLMAGTLDTLGGMDNLDVNAVTASFQDSLDETRAHHAQLVFLVLASKDQKANDLHPFQKAMLDFAAANHVPVVNMVDVLQSNAPANFYMDPVHPTAVGHKLIADQLYNVIRTLPAYQAACQQTAVNVANSASPTQSRNGATAHQ
ncbi:MAG TPA: SGNH/GDSL hydrolase family protein [Candidatus Solibacter sp.]|nr:SGNH/GDSL hydrolase family protein [Candidatus Solibacter sp.]